VVREIFEQCHEPGAEVTYRGLTLTHPSWICGETTVWEVYDTEGCWIDSIRADAFRSVRELAEYLETLSEHPNRVAAVDATRPEQWTD